MCWGGSHNNNIYNRHQILYSSTQKKNSYRESSSSSELPVAIERFKSFSMHSQSDISGI